MQSFVQQVHIRWADIDPNFHLRHSVYYDWAASCRVDFLGQHGLTSDRFQALHFGPIILREECVFRREIRMGDPVTISLTLLRSRRDYARWTIQHRIMKDPDTLSAIVTVDGAWLDTIKRKLAIPPEEIVPVFAGMPQEEGFQWEDA